MNEELWQKINDKYTSLGENPTTYLEGLVQAKPLTYWDYIEVDALLALQKPRTEAPDEEIFIMYHQVTELILKLMIHEIKQITGDHHPNVDELKKRLYRLIRYSNMMITSFSVMYDGMDYDSYNTFRVALAPASGFQSAQFRFLEIYCTSLGNLINEEGKKRLPENPSVEDYFEHVYWKDAGLKRDTGKKSLTLRMFEEKYMEQFIVLAKKMQGKTLEDKISALNDTELDEDLKSFLRTFDKLYNIEWPMTHLRTAQNYLDKKGENKAATGGSDWKKYLHPAFQQRKFFPKVWKDVEIENWAKDKI